jgi:hypothetical protein
MSNATIVAFAFGSKNAWGVFFEDNTIVNVVLQGSFFASHLHPAKVHGDVTRLIKCQIA